METVPTFCPLTRATSSAGNNSAFQCVTQIIRIDFGKFNGLFEKIILHVYQTINTVFHQDIHLIKHCPKNTEHYTSFFHLGYPDETCSPMFDILFGCSNRRQATGKNAPIFQPKLISYSRVLKLPISQTNCHFFCRFEKLEFHCTTYILHNHFLDL